MIRSRIIRAAFAYAVLAFAAGFALGLLRVPLLEPALGKPLSILIEAPFLLLACACAARWCTQRFVVAPTLAARSGMGAIALALLLTVELGVPALQGQSPVAYFAARDAASLALFALLLLAFATFPAFTLLLKEQLFSYGTLQLESVQLSTFGRRLQGAPDTLVGFRLEQLAITDAAVVAASGVASHPIVRASGASTDRVPGVVFEVTAAELARADAYEVDDYERVRVRLESGRSAWVYAAPQARA